MNTKELLKGTKVSGYFAKLNQSKKGGYYFNTYSWINKKLKDGESENVEVLYNIDGEIKTLNIKKEKKVNPDYIVWGEVTVEGDTKRIYENKYDWGLSVGTTLDKDNKIYLNIVENPDKTQIKISQYLEELPDEEQQVEEIEFGSEEDTTTKEVEKQEENKDAEKCEEIPF